MTTSIYPNWDNAWTATSIASSSISNAGSATTSAVISNDGFAATEVAVTVAYGAATEGVKVYILRDVDGTYETVNDTPFAFQMPYTTSGTRIKTLLVSGTAVSQFKVKVTNDSGASATVTVSYKQMVLNQA
jgi:hypothetical protein